MGRLVQGPGNIWRWIIDDFRSGIEYPGPQDSSFAVATEGMPESSFVQMRNARAKTGMLEPINGDTTYSVGIGVDTRCDLAFPYQTTITQLLTINGGVLRHVWSGGTTTSATTVTGVGDFGRRQACQFLGYMFVSGAVSPTDVNQTPQQLYRYHMDAPGSGRNGSSTFVTVTQLGKAGTPAPTTIPTMAISTTAGGLTTATTYKYRLAWKYGIGGELGMGWKESTTSITVTGPTQSVSITVDTHPPNEYAHVVKRSLYRNTTAFQNNFFLVTESTYTNSLPSSILDTASDAAIELGEQTDPLVQVEGTNTASDPYRAEMLPPKAVYCCVHESRVYLGDLIDSAGTRYPTSLVYSEISGISPHPDQFRPKNKITLPASYGRMTGIVSWMGNLYVVFERAIFVQTNDPGPGRIPAFAIVVDGFGATAPFSIATGPDGIFMLSGTLAIVFRGSPQPDVIGDRISSALQAVRAGSESRLPTAFGVYDPDIRGYAFALSGFSAAFEYSPQANGGRGFWTGFDGGVCDRWAYACGIGGRIVYACNDVSNGPTKGYFFKRGAGSLGVGIYAGSLGLAGSVVRYFRTPFFDMGYPNAVKVVKRVRLIYATSVTTGDYFQLNPDSTTSIVIAENIASAGYKSGKVIGIGITPTQFRSMQAILFQGLFSITTRATPFRAMEIEFTMDTEQILEDATL